MERMDSTGYIALISAVASAATGIILLVTNQRQKAAAAKAKAERDASADKLAADLELADVARKAESDKLAGQLAIIKAQAEAAASLAGQATVQAGKVRREIKESRAERVVQLDTVLTAVQEQKELTTKALDSANGTNEKIAAQGEEIARLRGEQTTKLQ